MLRISVSLSNDTSVAVSTHPTLLACSGLHRGRRGLEHLQGRTECASFDSSLQRRGEDGGPVVLVQVGLLVVLDPRAPDAATAADSSTSLPVQEGPAERRWGPPSARVPCPPRLRHQKKRCRSPKILERARRVAPFLKTKFVLQAGLRHLWRPCANLAGTRYRPNISSTVTRRTLPRRSASALHSSVKPDLEKR